MNLNNTLRANMGLLPTRFPRGKAPAFGSMATVHIFFVGVIDNEQACCYYFQHESR
jgi:hypothetical protein